MNSAVTSLLLIAAALTQESVLERAARLAESFWDQWTAVQCTESVVQTRLGADGKPIETRTADFDYVVFLKTRATGLAIEESRVARRGPSEVPEQRLLLTSGFPAFLLMFHRQVRDRFEFAATAEPNRVAFRSKREERAMSAFKLKDRFYPIFWTGIASIDPDSGAIRRIEASLDTPMEDIGLSEVRAEIEYAPAVLAGATLEFWLPKRALISVRSQHQEWRNIHEFSDYKRFSATTSTRPPGSN